jgi:hypothetical protein
MALEEDGVCFALLQGSKHLQCRDPADAARLTPVEGEGRRALPTGLPRRRRGQGVEGSRSWGQEEDDRRSGDRRVEDGHRRRERREEDDCRSKDNRERGGSPEEKVWAVAPSAIAWVARGRRGIPPRPTDSWNDRPGKGRGRAGIPLPRGNQMGLLAFPGPFFHGASRPGKGWGTPASKRVLTG